jgi:hypothetical protein
MRHGASGDRYDLTAEPMGAPWLTANAAAAHFLSGTSATRTGAGGDRRNFRRADGHHTLRNGYRPPGAARAGVWQARRAPPAFDLKIAMLTRRNARQLWR